MKIRFKLIFRFLFGKKEIRNGSKDFTDNKELGILEKRTQYERLTFS